jgi:hypothetical protein
MSGSNYVYQVEIPSINPVGQAPLPESAGREASTLLHVAIAISIILGAVTSLMKVLLSQQNSK